MLPPSKFGWSQGMGGRSPTGEIRGTGWDPDRTRGFHIPESVGPVVDQCHLVKARQDLDLSGIYRMGHSAAKAAF